MSQAATGMPEVVKALLRPEAYPHRPLQIELVQTQMSFLFLTGEYVYKIKKSVNLGYLDYTTLEKRHHFCQREVALNRRLSPGVYLGVVKVVAGGNGPLVESEGEAIEYAVKMRQLPREQMMDILLLKGQVSPDMVRKVAEKMAQFHQGAETGPGISAFGGLDIIAQNNAENFEQTRPYIGLSLSKERFLRLQAWTQRFVNEKASLFQQRVEGGRIRDCHGDLHSAHICFTDGLVIYDCIEFNDRFRYGDIASEIAFLSMDMDHKGQPDLGRHFVNSYIDFSRDGDLVELIDFYRCYRAHVRGKVESFKLDDPNIPQGEKGDILAGSRRYFTLASQYAGLRPVLIIMAGLVGTGKTTVAQALNRRLNLPVVSSDVIRKRMAGVPLTEHHFEPFGEGLYSDAFSRQTYSEIFREASEVLDSGDSVILDASFKKAADRQKAREIARENGADFLLVECLLSDERIKERLTARSAAGSVSDGRWELLEDQKQDFDKIDGKSERNYIAIDTSQPEEHAIGKILIQLGIERDAYDC